MNAVGYLILALARVLNMITMLYTFIVAAAVIISWVNPDPYNPIVRILRQLTEPVFRITRRVMPRALWRTGLDLSPILVFFVLILFDTVVVNLLFDMAKDLLE